jgi:hypothetical protein
MTGPITTNSTFDGRDVSVDGTKLDGIAAGANNYSFPYTVSAAAGNSTVVQRDGSGYIFGRLTLTVQVHSQLLVKHLAWVDLLALMVLTLMVVPILLLLQAA